MPDSLSLTNFSGIKSSAASSSVVKRGQFAEYEQHAPQAWHGRSVAGAFVSMLEGLARTSVIGQLTAKHLHQVSLGASQTRLLRHLALSRSRRSGYFSSRWTAS